MTSEPNSSRRLRGWACACVALLVAGCAATPAPDDGPRQYLDETTAATVTVGGHPMVFALERPELAVHARDYLTLVPIDVNRSGTHAQYFYGYIWSTIDKRGVGEGSDSATRFELVADGRRIPLTPVPGKARDLGLGAAPLQPPAASAELLVSATSREVQDFVAGATEIMVVAGHDGVSERFALWTR